MLFPTTLVGSYPQPEWLIDRKKLAGRFPPRVRAQELNLSFRYWEGAVAVEGVGEGGAIGAPAAVINAIVDALRPLGVDVFEMPATPQRLRALLRAAGKATGKQSHE